MTAPLLHPAVARNLFREFAESEITSENLARGALLIALEDNPSLDLDQSMRALDDLANRVRLRCVPGEPAVFRLGHLHAEMFDVDGYSGEREDYYDPRNAYLHEVIERKRGLPISLAIIFLHVAQRIGLQAFGVGLPGHFIVKVQFELNEVYVDPFHGGDTLMLPEIRAMLDELSGGQIQLANEHLRAWSGRETLVRVLANLQGMWERAGDPKKASAARERAELLRSLAL